MAKRTSIQARILTVAAVLLIGAAITVSYWALSTFKSQFLPAMQKKAAVVDQSLQKQLGKVLDYGVPVDRLRGLSKVFEAVQKDNPDIAYLAVAGKDGNVISEHWQVSRKAGAGGRRTLPASDLFLSKLPLKQGGHVVGWVKVGADKTYITRRMEGIVSDIVTVLVVSGLMALELLLFLNAFMVTGPMASIREVMTKVKEGDFTSFVSHQGSDEVGRLSAAVNRALLKVEGLYRNLVDAGGRLAGNSSLRFAGSDGMHPLVSDRLRFIRPPLFLLVFSESMSLSFFPMYVDTLYKPIAGIPKDVVIGLPISLFMLVWALSMPFAGQWSDRAGRRRTVLTGTAITAVGLVLTGLATNMIYLLIWRSLTAIGYGIVFISAQGYVTDHTTPKNRTKGMAFFLSGFFSGSLCGAAIGGILADRLGYRPTFILSAILSVASAVFVYRFLNEHRRKSQADAAPKVRLGLADFRMLFRNKYFLTVTFLSAIPAKMALTGFLYYAGPLYLVQLGVSQSASGRILMAYGLAIVIVSPISAWVADKVRKRPVFVVCGGTLAAISMLMVHYLHSLPGMLAGVVMLGLAHAIGVSPQLSLITDMQTKTGVNITVGKTIGIFRLSERIGNISGPLIAGVLISTFGFSGAFLGMGVFFLSCAALFSILMALFTRIDNRRIRDSEMVTA